MGTLPFQLEYADVLPGFGAVAVLCHTYRQSAVCSGGFLLTVLDPGATELL